MTYDRDFETPCERCGSMMPAAAHRASGKCAACGILERRGTLLACLAMCRALPDFILDSTPRGRLRNRYRKLRTETDRVLFGLPKPSKTELEILSKRLDEWGRMTGWYGKERHVCTIVSFLIAICVDYLPGELKIMSALEDIHNYFARVKAVPKPSEWAGTVAYLKWVELFDTAQAQDAEPAEAAVEIAEAAS